MRAMSDSQQPPNPRARLQALLAIPERQRTDEQWDELNELEIMLAAGNRQGAPDPRLHANPGGRPPRRDGPPRGRNPQQRKFHPKRGPRRHPGR